MNVSTNRDGVHIYALPGSNEYNRNEHQNHPHLESYVPRGCRTLFASWGWFCRMSGWKWGACFDVTLINHGGCKDAIDKSGFGENQKTRSQVGKNYHRRSFRPRRPSGLDVSFTEMENVWVAAAEGLIEGVACAALSQQAENLQTEQACPQCGHACELDSQERTM